MQILKDKILAEGVIAGNDILRVDTFLNNGIDPVLMEQIGREFADHFAGMELTKVVTIESSGIAPALMTALALGVPLVVLKKHASKVINPDVLQTEVTAYTTGRTYEMTLAAGLIDENDHVLIVDDFLADGEAVTGAMRLIRSSHATIGGIGIVIEKSFQPGITKLKNSGVEVYSLARITSLAEGKPVFAE